jgi:hypothetical protein
MRRNSKPITASPEIVQHIHGLSEANFHLLTKLIGWLDENERRQEKYRFAMVHRLARVEAAISLLLVEQQAQTQGKPPWYQADKLAEDAKAAEEFIASQSKRVGLKMVRYIHGKDPAPEKHHDRRRRWWGWEI